MCTYVFLPSTYSPFSILPPKPEYSKSGPGYPAPGTGPGPGYMEPVSGYSSSGLGPGYPTPGSGFISSIIPSTMSVSTTDSINIDPTTGGVGGMVVERGNASNIAIDIIEV